MGISPPVENAQYLKIKLKCLILIFHIVPFSILKHLNFWRQKWPKLRLQKGSKSKNEFDFGHLKCDFYKGFSTTVESQWKYSNIMHSR